MQRLAFFASSVLWLAAYIRPVLTSTNMQQHLRRSNQLLLSPQRGFLNRPTTSVFAVPLLLSSSCNEWYAWLVNPPSWITTPLGTLVGTLQPLVLVTPVPTSTPIP